MTPTTYWGVVVSSLLPALVAAQQTGKTEAAATATSQPTYNNRDTLRTKLEAMSRRLKTLEREREQRELRALRQQAEAEAALDRGAQRQSDATAKLDQRSFGSAQRALQALNPELSVVTDIVAQALLRDSGYTSEEDRSGFVLRQFGIHFQATLDPFSLTKATIEISPEGVELEEAFISWAGLLPGVSLTVGRFRQQLGVVNRWHQESLDQLDYPLALQYLFGDEGLAQTGLALQWLPPPLWAHANGLEIQVTNGENDRLFSGDLYSLPSVLVRITSYYDLSTATYFELGLTGMTGWNHQTGASDATVDDKPRQSWAWAADWSLLWEPRISAKYRNLQLRGELYGVRKNLRGPDVTAWGVYQALQAKLTRAFELGVRFDWSQTLDDPDREIWGAQPYLVWWQSPWVRARLHYAFSRNHRTTGDDHRLVLQLTLAAGPHKHERY